VYYGNKAILTLFLTVSDLARDARWPADDRPMQDALLFSEPDATSLFFWYSAATYLSPIIGGYLCDAWLGKQHTILSGSIVYIVGAVALTAAASGPFTWLAFAGMALVALGTGGIKPCVAAFGAQQFKSPSYKPPTGWDNERLLGAYFAAFYFSINLGSVFAYLLMPIARVNGGFSAAFGLATGVLVVSLVVFLVPSKHYIREKPKGSILASVVQVMFSACVANRRIHGWCWCCSRATPEGGEDTTALTGPDDVLDEVESPISRKSSPALTEREVALRKRAGCLNIVRGQFSDEIIDGTAAILAILPIFTVIALFWTCYDQQGNTWVIQARKMDLGFMQPDQLGGLNPVMVMAMLPLFRAVILPCLENCGSRVACCRPTPLRKMGIGMVLAAVTFVMSAALQWLIDSSPPNSISVWLQIPQWLLITIAEIFLSVTGLEWAYTQADKNLQGVCMAAWFISNGLGDILGGVLYQFFKGFSQTSIFLIFAGLMLVAFFGFVLLALRYESLPPPSIDDDTLLSSADHAESTAEALGGYTRDGAVPSYGAADDDGASISGLSLAPMEHRDSRVSEAFHRDSSVTRLDDHL
jgi:proton-dependent oligopeptide transporter, POT family